MSDRECGICGGQLGAVLAVHNKPDRFEAHLGIPQAGYRREWVVCNSCGSASNRMDPSNAELLSKLADGYYEVDLAGLTIEKKFAKVMAMPADKSDNAGRVNRVLTRVTSWRTTLGLGTTTARVLDVGAGTGVFLAKFLQEADQNIPRWSATAVEPDPMAAEHLRRLQLFDVWQGPFDASLVSTSYDLVTLNKVVEHLPEPHSLVSTLGTIISPSFGLLYIEVPDVLTIGRRPLTDNILGSLHHYLYSPRGLIALFERTGLNVLDIGRVADPSGKITLFGFACPDVALDCYMNGKLA